MPFEPPLPHYATNDKGRNKRADSSERDHQDVDDRFDVHKMPLTGNDRQQIDGRSQPNQLIPKAKNKATK